MAEPKYCAPASTGMYYTDPTYLDNHFRAAQPEYESMLRSVEIGAGFHVLDAGCGPGSFLPLLSEMVGPTGHISCIDLSPENTETVKSRVAKSPLLCPVDVQPGSLLALPYADRTFDAVWSSAVFQYIPEADWGTVLSELRRVVRPGGLIAIKDSDLTLWYLSAVDPELLWRTFAALRPHFVQIKNELRAPLLHRLLQRHDLRGVRQASTLVERWAPLPSAEQEFVTTIFTGFAAIVQTADMSESDKAAWQALSDVSNPDHPMKRADFYYREGHTITVGWVPA